MRSQSSLERVTRQLLKDHRVAKPAVNVHELATKLGIEIKAQPPADTGVSEALLRDGKRVIIGVNPGHSVARQRFTIAHELGHFALHDHSLRVDHGFSETFGQPRLRARAFRNEASSLAVDPNEIEANRFAAALLMPIDFLERSLKKRAQPLRESDIHELAEQYEVSTQAMTFRLMNLGVPVDVAGAQ